MKVSTYRPNKNHSRGLKVPLALGSLAVRLLAVGMRRDLGTLQQPTSGGLPPTQVSDFVCVVSHRHAVFLV